LIIGRRDVDGFAKESVPGTVTGKAEGIPWWERIRVAIMLDCAMEGRAKCMMHSSVLPIKKIWYFQGKGDFV